VASVLLCLTTAPSSGRAELIHDPSGTALDAFRRALARTESKAAGALTRIVQIGDSHTASDFWTGALRRRLQARYGDGGHGFVVPGRPWASYKHLDVVHWSDGRWKVRRLSTVRTAVEALGLGGVVMTTRRPMSRAWVTTTRAKSAPVGGSVSRFDVFLLFHPEGGSLRFRIDDKLWSELSTHMPVPQPGFRRFDVPDGPHKLELDVSGDGEVRVFGVVLERAGPGVVVDSVGVPGLRAEHLLLGDADVLAAHVERRQPDLLMIAYGTNEANRDGFDVASYPAVMSRVIAHARKGAPGASCLVLAPLDRTSRTKGGGRASPPILSEIIGVQREAAVAAGCAFWDTRAAMGGPGSIDRWVSDGLAQPDHVHLNQKGYARLAELLEAALTGQ
jgi:lysophospholipase L1-like esterase